MLHTGRQTGTASPNPAAANDSANARGLSLKHPDLPKQIDVAAVVPKWLLEPHRDFVEPEEHNGEDAGEERCKVWRAARTKPTVARSMDGVYAHACAGRRLVEGEEIVLVGDVLDGKNEAAAEIM